MTYTAKNSPKFDLRKSIRKRPGMFIGSLQSSGIIRMLSGAITDCIDLSDLQDFSVSMTLLPNSTFEFIFNHPKIHSCIQEQIKKEEIDLHLYDLNCLYHLSEKVQLILINGDETKLGLSLDTTILKAEVDYFELVLEMRRVAMLNAGLSIQLIDERVQPCHRNHFYIPEGLHFSYQQLVTTQNLFSSFFLEFKTIIKEREYHIIIAYQKPSHPQHIESYANHLSTSHHGSLVQGVLNGISTTAQQLITISNRADYHYQLKYRLDGLILICSVKGDDFIFEGSTKRKLGMPEIKQEIKKTTQQQLNKHFEAYPEDKDEFLARFCNKLN